MEIVSEPDMRSADEAAAYVRKLRAICAISAPATANMDEGSMRCDVNSFDASPRRTAWYALRDQERQLDPLRDGGDRDTKRAVRVEILEDGGKIDQETRLWGHAPGRDAVDAVERRSARLSLFPRSDLLPLVLEDGLIERIKATLPELPDAKETSLHGEWGLSPYDASVLVAEQERAAFYEEVAKGRDPKLAPTGPSPNCSVRSIARGKDLADSPVSASKLGGLIDLISDNTISGPYRQRVFAADGRERQRRSLDRRRKRFAQVVDTGAIDKLVDEVIMAAEPGQGR